MDPEIYFLAPGFSVAPGIVFLSTRESLDVKRSGENEADDKILIPAS